MATLLDLHIQRQQNISTGPDPILEGLVFSSAFENTTVWTDDLGLNDGIHTNTSTGTGANGDARVYDGATSFSTALYSSDFDITDSVTVMVDFYPTANGQSSTSNVIALFQATGGNHIYHIGHKSDNTIRGRIYTSTFNDLITTETIPLNEWSRIILRWQNGEPIRLVIDGGTEESGSNLSGTPPTPGLPLGVSMDPNWGATSDVRQITGRVDNTMIWTRKLTDVEVDQLFDGNPTYAELS